jgi:anoctamin-10
LLEDRNWTLTVELALNKLECNLDQLLFFQGVTLHVSVSKIKYLEVAEELELKKRDKYGMTREFTVSQLDDFLDDGMSVDDLLTTAERVNIVRHELENIRARNEDEQVPGYPTFRLYEGQSIGTIETYA